MAITKRLCSQKRCVDDALLTKKENRDVLESFSERMQSVRRFLEMFKPSLVYDIVPLHDVCGPTAEDPNIQALVVSMETASGGKAGTYFLPFPSWWCAHLHGHSSGQSPGGNGLPTITDIRDRRDIT